VRLATETSKRIPRMALTQYAMYNIAKQVGKWIGLKLTKDGVGKSMGKVIPFIGAPISAATTYFTFKPMAKKLKKHLDEQW
jgi:putative membrane protein